MNVIVGEGLILTRLADLRVLEEAFRLPHAMVVPDVLLSDPFLELGGYDRSTLVELGAQVGHLDGDGVQLASTFQIAYPALSTVETFALVLAEGAGEDSILLTGQVPLCRSAEARGLEVRGLPWILDEMIRRGTAGIERPRKASW